MIKMFCTKSYKATILLISLVSLLLLASMSSVNAANNTTIKEAQDTINKDIKKI